MTVELAIMFGVGILGFLFFDGWFRLRDDHPTLSLGFFGMGLTMINFMAFLVNLYLSEASVLANGAPVGNAIFTIVMWMSILAALYIFGMVVWDIVRWFLFFMYSMIGKRPPDWVSGYNEDKEAGLTIRV